MIWLVVLAVVGILASVLVGLLIGRALRDYSAPCSCEPNAWDPYCSVHGTKVRA